MKKAVLAFTCVLSLSWNASAVYAQGLLTSLNEQLAEKDIEISASADVAVYDKYIWRGFRLDGDKSIQPAVTLGVGPIEGGFWGSWDMQNDDQLSSDESDGWIGLNFDLGFLNEDLAIVGVSFGHTWYSFPEASLYSKEYYLGFSLDTFLAPSFTWYHDYEDESQGGADGNYYAFAVGHSFTLSEDHGISFDLGQEIGLNDEAFIAGSGGYSTTKAGLTIPLTSNLSMSPIVAYTAPWGDLSDGNDGNQENEFWGGISFSFSG